MISRLEAQLSSCQRPWRMFMDRPKSQNFCDPEPQEARVIPSMWFPKPPKPGVHSHRDLGPCTSEAIGM